MVEKLNCSKGLLGKQLQGLKIDSFQLPKDNPLRAVGGFDSVTVISQHSGVASLRRLSELNTGSSLSGLKVVIGFFIKYING